MKNKLVFIVIVIAFILGFIGCNRTTAQNNNQELLLQEQSLIQEQPVLRIENIKVTNDIDSTFNVQAIMQRNMWRTGNGDLGIVGKIENGVLNISIPVPTEEMLWNPIENDLGSEPEGLKISQLLISTSNASIVLDQPYAGGNVAIWYANKDGMVDFLNINEKISLKAGWNFIEVFQGVPIPNARVWTLLQDVYDIGYYKWILLDNR